MGDWLDVDMTDNFSADEIIGGTSSNPKCLGQYDYYGEFDCDYNSVLVCEDCKYGLGRKDPAAKCNAI